MRYVTIIGKNKINVYGLETIKEIKVSCGQDRKRHFALPPFYEVILNNNQLEHKEIRENSQLFEKIQKWYGQREIMGPRKCNYNGRRYPVQRGILCNSCLPSLNLANRTVNPTNLFTEDVIELLSKKEKSQIYLAYMYKRPAHSLTP